MQARIAYAFQQIAPAKVTIAHALVPQHVARLTQPIERGQYPTLPRSTATHRGRRPADSRDPRRNMVDVVQTNLSCRPLS